MVRVCGLPSKLNQINLETLSFELWLGRLSTQIFGSLNSEDFSIPSNFLWPLSCQHYINLWIGLRENLNRKPMGFYHQIL
jgi:hypothetical protein